MRCTLFFIYFLWAFVFKFVAVRGYRSAILRTLLRRGVLFLYPDYYSDLEYRYSI